MDPWKFLFLSTFQSPPTLVCSALYPDIFSCKSEDLGEMELLCLCENWGRLTFTLMRAVMPPLWLPLQSFDPGVAGDSSYGEGIEESREQRAWPPPPAVAVRVTFNHMTGFKSCESHGSG